MASNKRRCIKNMLHEWVTINEYRTHILKQCERCKCKYWKARRN